MSDADIEKAIETKEMTIDPLCEDSLTPIGYDLRVGDQGWIWTKKGIDRREIRHEGGITLEPGDIALIVTMEEVKLSKEIRGTIHSKVSIDSLGLGAISTTIDPTWGNTKGGLLLVKVQNTGMVSLGLRHGEPFCTALFERVNTPAKRENKRPGGRDDVIERVKAFLEERNMRSKERSRRYRFLRILKSNPSRVVLSLLSAFGLSAVIVVLTSFLFPSMKLETLGEVFGVACATVSAALIAVSVRRS